MAWLGLSNVLLSYKKRFSLLKISAFGFVFLVYILIASGRIESIDGMGSLNVSRNVVSKNGFTISPPEYNTGMNYAIGKGDKYYGVASLGYTLVLIPVAFFVRVIYKINNFTPASYFPLESDYLLTFLASFVNPILGFLLFLVDYKLYKMLLKNSTKAFIVSLLVSFSTFLLPLSKHSFVHILFSLVLMVSVYYLLKFFKTKRILYLVISGMFMGFEVIVYNMTFVLPLVTLTVLLMYQLYTENFRLLDVIKKIIIWYVPIIGFVILLLFYNFVRFGSFLNFGYSFTGSEFSMKSYFFEGIWGLLLSPGKSLLVFSPIVIISMYLALKNIKKSLYSKLFVLLLTLYIFLYGRYTIWSGELCYGPRYFAPIIPIAGLVIAEYWKKINKIILLLLVIIGVYVQLIGVVIPYQIQYPPYDLKVFNYPVDADRETQFQAYAIGQFLPRLSPPYRLKGLLVERISQVKNIFSTNRNKIDFVSNVYFPEYYIQKGVKYVKYRHAKSIFDMYAFSNLEFKKVILNVTSVNQPLEKLEICVRDKCIKSYNFMRDDTLYSLYFENTVKIQKGEYVKFLFNHDNSKENNFELDINSISFDRYKINLDSYNAVNKDSYFLSKSDFSENNKSIDYLWEIRNREVEGLVNITPDFWWFKTHVYYNLPNIFRYSFWVFLITLIINFIILLSLLVYKYRYDLKQTVKSEI
jgi:hypothetical protein